LISCGVPLAESHHVVVDGSNVATEGRTFPSLEQLDQAVRTPLKTCRQHHRGRGAATFEHRVRRRREEVRRRC
jgi:hypothetical protein